MSAIPHQPHDSLSARAAHDLPLHDLESEREGHETDTPTAPSAPAHRGPHLVLLILLAVLSGVAGATIAVALLYQTNVAPLLINRQQQDLELQRLAAEVRGLNDQLDSVRTQQLDLEADTQEIQQVVATITINTANELTAAREQAAVARRELNEIKVESALTALNRVFDQAGRPLRITETTIANNEIRLSVEYWGFRITAREALQYLDEFRPQLEAAFPGRKIPADFVITFNGVQNGSRTIFRNGIWIPEP